MTRIQDLKNHCVNIKRTMSGLVAGNRLTSDERNTIIQFYAEVMNVIASIESNNDIKEAQS